MQLRLQCWSYFASNIFTTMVSDSKSAAAVIAVSTAAATTTAIATRTISK